MGKGHGGGGATARPPGYASDCCRKNECDIKHKYNNTVIVQMPGKMRCAPNQFFT